MGLFNFKKAQSEKEILQGQKAELSQKVTELQGKRTKLQNALVIAETNELVDPTASNKKQVTKFKDAIENTEGEIAELTKQLQEVNSKIGAIVAQEKEAEINEAGKAHEENTYLSRKRAMLRNELDGLNNWLNTKTGIVEPQELKKLAGVKWNEHFNLQEHAPFVEAQQKADKAGKERAQKEFDELMKQINDFLERN